MSYGICLHCDGEIETERINLLGADVAFCSRCAHSVEDRADRCVARESKEDFWTYVAKPKQPPGPIKILVNTVTDYQSSIKPAYHGWEKIDHEFCTAVHIVMDDDDKWAMEVPGWPIPAKSSVYARTSCQVPPTLVPRPKVRLPRSPLALIGSPTHVEPSGLQQPSECAGQGS